MKKQKPVNRTKSVQELEEIFKNGNFELISYGIAPNPNGFCYEFIGESERPKDEETRLNELLDNLNSDEEKYLRVFWL